MGDQAIEDETIWTLTLSSGSESLSFVMSSVVVIDHRIKLRGSNAGTPESDN